MVLNIDSVLQPVWFSMLLDTHLSHLGADSTLTGLKCMLTYSRVPWCLLEQYPTSGCIWQIPSSTTFLLYDNA
jgi:hypothetical protein